MKKTFWAVLAMIFSLSATHAATIPAAVLTAFQQKFPTATDVDWEKEGDGSYEAEFEIGESEMSANFSADGKWLETEAEVPTTTLPAAVLSAFKAKTNKTIVGACKIETASGKIFYEIEYKSGLLERELFFDEKGTLLPTDEE